MGAVVLSDLATGDVDFFAVAGLVHQLAFPVPVVYEPVVYFLNRLGECGGEEIMADLPQDLVGGPAVNTFCTVVPKGEASIEIVTVDGIGRQVEEGCLTRDVRLHIAKRGEVAGDTDDANNIAPRV